MKLEFEVATLSEAFRLLQIRAGASIRDIARDLNMNYTTIWRAINMPTKATAKTLIALVRWFKIEWADVESLWDAELDKYR